MYSIDEINAGLPELPKRTCKKKVADGVVGQNHATLPGDDFIRRGDIRPYLVKHGWTLHHEGENEKWTRPGKSSGTSATLRDGNFHVFSSSTEHFEANADYSIFAAYARLEHKGNFKAAAKALRAVGYGGVPSGTLGTNSAQNSGASVDRDSTPAKPRKNVSPNSLPNVPNENQR